MPPDSPFEGAPLPVPYENPWGLLARDCLAVAASLRLQARELWRRNRQGDLRRPGFWPKDLAPLFWPIARALAVVLVSFVVVGGSKLMAPGLAGNAPGGVAPAADMSQATLEAAPAELAPAEVAPAEVAPGEAILGFDAPRLAEPLAPESLVAGSLSDGAQTAAPRLDGPRPPEPDPLDEAMGQLDPGHWITAIDRDPERGTLQLVLAAPFTALPEAQQLQQAETWQTQAIAFGFDRLELTDRQGRPIGRQARVGSGMILLTPQHLS